MEKRYVHKEGHEVWGLVQGLNKNSPFAEGYKPYFIGFVQDISLIKRQEEELRTTKEKYESLIQNSSDAIVIYDLEGQVLQVNKAFTHIFGWKENEVMGLKLPITFPDKISKAEELIRKIIIGEIVHNLEFFVI
jgi:PAS domain-containing protein